MIPQIREILPREAWSGSALDLGRKAFTASFLVTNHKFTKSNNSYVYFKHIVHHSKREGHFEFSYDRYLAGNPADTLETLPHAKVRLGPGQPGIWTGRPPQLLEQQPLKPCHGACKLAGVLCLFGFCRSWTGTLCKKKHRKHHNLGQSSTPELFTTKIK